MDRVEAMCFSKLARPERQVFTAAAHSYSWTHKTHEPHLSF